MPDLKTTVEEWQARLRLSDWDITYEVVERRELENKGAGETVQAPELNRAKLRILREEQHSEFEGTQEETVVHELLHVWDSTFLNRDKMEDFQLLAHERFTETLARVLVRLKYEGQNKKRKV